MPSAALLAVIALWVGLGCSRKPAPAVEARPRDSTLVALDDAELERRYLSVAWKNWGDSTYRPYQSLLDEIAHRGGPAWIGFLQAELQRLRNWRAESDKVSCVPQVAVLTALRRAQRRPDPLIVEIECVGSPTTVFPELPAVRVRLLNADPEETIELFIDELSSDGTGSDTFRLLAQSADGRTPMPVLRAGVMMGIGVPLPRIHLLPGESSTLESPIDLRKKILLTSAGEYHVALRYHEFPGDLAEGDFRVDSRPLSLRLEPRVVRMGRREAERLRAHVASLDHELPIVVIDADEWHETRDFTKTTVLSHAEQLYRAGWKSVPLLLEALEQPELPAIRKAWIAALLWDLVGSIDPHAVQDQCVFVWLMSQWPYEIALSDLLEGASLPAEKHDCIAGLAKRADLWRELGSCVKLELVP